MENLTSVGASAPSSAIDNGSSNQATHDGRTYSRNLPCLGLLAQIAVVALVAVAVLAVTTVE